MPIISTARYRGSLVPPTLPPSTKPTRILRTAHTGVVQNRPSSPYYTAHVHRSPPSQHRAVAGGYLESVVVTER
eukprot:1392742-Rhodomonas_salina.1